MKNWYTDLESALNVKDFIFAVVGSAMVASAGFRMLTPAESINTAIVVFFLMAFGGALIVRSVCRFIHQII